MEVRDAVEADCAAMAAIADAPADAMRNLVHDRTVRVAQSDAAANADPNVDVSTDTDESELLGFVSFDAQKGVVHVTQLDGTGDACERLLAEPVRFAESEGMSVELLAPESETQVKDAAEEMGFALEGNGPRFEGAATVRYRLEP